jgi:hypothetical protein
VARKRAAIGFAGFRVKPGMTSFRKNGLGVILDLLFRPIWHRLMDKVFTGKVKLP